MKIKDQIPSSIITATVALLSSFIPDLTPTRLIAALQEYDSKDKEQTVNNRFQKPFTVAEAAAWLQLSKMSIYRLAQRGEINLLKIGNSTRIPAEDINNLMTPDR